MKNLFIYYITNDSQTILSLEFSLSCLFKYDIYSAKLYSTNKFIEKNIKIIKINSKYSAHNNERNYKIKFNKKINEYIFKDVKYVKSYGENYQN